MKQPLSNEMKKGIRNYGSDNHEDYEDCMNVKTSGTDHIGNIPGQAKAEGQAEADASKESDEQSLAGVPPAGRIRPGGKAPYSSVERSVTLAETTENEEGTVQNPGDVDEAKWEAAKKASAKEYGPDNWKTVTKIYKSMGGKFHKKS
jgi:hypothetical protein